MKKNSKIKCIASFMAVFIMFEATRDFSEIRATDTDAISEDGQDSQDVSESSDDIIVLRVGNYDEYIDLGGWSEDEAVELENGATIIGENDINDDFENWYYETYGQKVDVQYSCFATVDEMYSKLQMGDVYDVACTSDSMAMKLMNEDMMVPFSDEFKSSDSEYNYYTMNVSPYISGKLDSIMINDEPISKYVAGYMWGFAGYLYNPEKVPREDVSTWSIALNRDYKNMVEVKDDIRCTYFIAMAIAKRDLLMSDEFRSSEDYLDNMYSELNDYSEEGVDTVEAVLQDVNDNIYAYGIDSGKADMVSGKIVADYEWSGDAVYAMNLADEEGTTLNFVVPEECSYVWFDSWVMLKCGLSQDSAKQQVAEAYINYMSRTDSAVRNMYYTGYTSVVAGNDSDDTVLQYLNYNYGAPEGCEATVDYPLGYFFTGDNSDETYVITADATQIDRQLYAQYPTEEVMDRCTVIGYADKEQTADRNQMWINIRCFNIKQVPVYVCIIVGVMSLAVLTVLIAKRRNKTL